MDWRKCNKRLLLCISVTEHALLLPNFTCKICRKCITELQPFSRPTWRKSSKKLECTTTKALTKAPGKWSQSTGITRQLRTPKSFPLNQISTWGGEGSFHKLYTLHTFSSHPFVYCFLGQLAVLSNNCACCNFWNLIYVQDTGSFHVFVPCSASSQWSVE